MRAHWEGWESGLQRAFLCPPPRLWGSYMHTVCVHMCAHMMLRVLRACLPTEVPALQASLRLWFRGVRPPRTGTRAGGTRCVLICLGPWGCVQGNRVCWTQRHRDTR